jgi:hypothetical protein
MVHLGHFIIFKHSGGFIVYNEHKPFHHKGIKGHSHLRNYSSARYAVICVKQNKIPRKCSLRYLETLIRLSEDEKYIKKVQQLIKTRKQKGKKQKPVKKKLK